MTRDPCANRVGERGNGMARLEDSGIGGPFPGEAPPLGLLAGRRVQLGVEESAQLIEARRRGAPRLVEHRLRRRLEVPLEAALGRGCCDLNNRDVSVLAGTSTL